MRVVANVISTLSDLDRKVRLGEEFTQGHICSERQGRNVNSSAEALAQLHLLVPASDWQVF